MRVLFLFLTLFFFSFFIPLFKGNATVYIKPQIKAEHTFLIKKSNTSPKKTNQNSCKKDYTNFFDRIHQHINHVLGLAINLTDKFYQEVILPSNIVKARLLKSNYSYHFIFQCLYPKHTFW